MSLSPFGLLVREWRARRGLSQLALSGRLGTSTRHLSFVETGRAQASQEFVLRLATALAVTERERNALLLAAGYAPLGLDEARALELARGALGQILRAHLPNPALAMNREWNLLEANQSVKVFLSAVAPRLLQPPVNLVRIALSTDGLRPHVLNFAELVNHLVARLERQAFQTGKRELRELWREAVSLAGGASRKVGDEELLTIPLHLRTRFGVLKLLSTTSILGIPGHVALEELALETFYPLDDSSAEILRHPELGTWREPS